MNLQFSYGLGAIVPVVGVPYQRSLPVRRPFVPIRLVGHHGRSWIAGEALLDTGSNETVFPMAVAREVGVVLETSRHSLVWRGNRHDLAFAKAGLEILGQRSTVSWSASVGFSTAPLRYPILGIRGCLEFFNATFRGDMELVELEPNRRFSGKIFDIER